MKRFYLLTETSSSFIKGFEFETDTNELTVNFKNAKSYKYFDVPVETFDLMRVAESKGKFLHENLKDKYKGEPLDA